MPSPFPGMDPYLEDPELWPDVHHALIAGIQEQLSSKLRPRYVARVELRTFLVEPDDPGGELYIIPDARIVERGPQRNEPARGANEGGVATAIATTVAPIDITGQVVRAARHRYLEIRDPSDRRVVTVIEIISPSNKVTGSAGRRALREKREEVGNSDSSWLEIDLLRRGTRTVTWPGMKASDYLAYADRTTPDDRRQLAWPISLRERLPRLPVPLRPGEADVALDLQTVLDAAYERAAYDMDVNYGSPPNPPLTGENEKWADALLREKKARA